MQELIALFPELGALLAKLALAVGSARLILKPIQPLVSAAIEYIKLSPSKSDDALLEKVAGSKLARLLKFLADYLLSIKV